MDPAYLERIMAWSIVTQDMLASASQRPSSSPITCASRAQGGIGESHRSRSGRGAPSRCRQELPRGFDWPEIVRELR